MRTCFACFALFAAAVCYTSAAAAPIQIPLESYLASQTAIRASVNGHEGLFLFDTGEGVSTISPAFAAKIGCVPWGQVSGFRMSGERLDFPRCDNVGFDARGEHFMAPIAGVFDIMSLIGSDAPAVDGALGLDIFAGRIITIEPRANLLIVETPRSLAARIRAAKTIQVRLVRDAEGVSLAVDAAIVTPKGLVWMEIDTGNGGSLVVGNHVAPLLGLPVDLKEPQPVRFELAGGIEVTGSARTRNLIMDGNISNQFWKNWNLTLDLAHSRAWIAPAGRATDL